MPKAFPKLLGVEISIPYRIFKLSNINNIEIIINNFYLTFDRNRCKSKTAISASVQVSYQHFFNMKTCQTGKRQLKICNCCITRNNCN